MHSLHENLVSWHCHVSCLVVDTVSPCLGQPYRTEESPDDQVVRTTASEEHEMYCHDLEVMGLNPSRVELGV